VFHGASQHGSTATLQVLASRAAVALLIVLASFLMQLAGIGRHREELRSFMSGGLKHGHVEKTSEIAAWNTATSANTRDWLLMEDPPRLKVQGLFSLFT
jgi:hypothetical protein